MGINSGNNISILLVEDHRVTLNGLEACLANEDGFKVIGNACNSEEAIRLAAELKPDIILLDLHLPGSRGIEEILLELSLLSTRIIAFSSEDRLPVINLVMSRGAMAFLSKAESLETICKIIRAVAAGESGFVSKNLTKPKRYELSAAEAEVLPMLARGLKYEEIAEQRHTSPHTVRKQCDRLQIKLGLSSREELIVWAVENGYGHTKRLNE